MTEEFSWDSKFADRVWDVRGEKGDSPFFRLLELTRGVKNLISLGRGDPDLPTPAHIIEAARQALVDGKTKYTPPPGLDELRIAIADKLKEENNLTYEPLREVTVTSGTQEAINVIYQTLLNSGDEVLLPDPYYMAYWQGIRAVGALPVTLPTYMEDNFIVRPDAVREAITPRTKAIVLVSPSNPTGTVIDPATAEKIASIALERDLVVISDELYEKVVFDGARTTSIAGLPDMWDRTITVNGLSKAYNMTGMRVGYYAAPATFSKAALELRHMASICAPTVSQWAAVAALAGSQTCIKETLSIYSPRRRLMLDCLRDACVPCNHPKGAFFVFADISATSLSSFEFCVELLKSKQVLVFPGTQYGKSGKGFVRISFLAPIDRLEEALERFGAFYKARTS